MKTNEYGLVPGKAIKNFDVYKAGQLCGFEPHVAQRLKARGLWKPTDAGDAAAAEAANEEKEIEDAAAEAEFLIGVDSGTLKIPHNWREQHHTKKKSWATQIKGEDVTKVDAADEIIAAAVKDQEDALSQTE